MRHRLLLLDLLDILHESIDKGVDAMGDNSGCKYSNPDSDIEGGGLSRLCSSVLNVSTQDSLGHRPLRLRNSIRRKASNVLVCCGGETMTAQHFVHFLGLWYRCSFVS